MMNKSYTVLIVTITVALAVLLAPLSNAAAKDTKTGVFDSAVTWYVDHAATGMNTGGSWTDAFTRLQSALEQAQSGDQIWVAQGVYTPTNTTDRTAAFNLKNDIGLYGGFAGGESDQSQRDWQAHTTVLSGDLGGDDLTDANGVLTSTAGIQGDNAYHVVVSSGLTQTARLDGFYITGGKADGSSALNVYGGGVYNSNSRLSLANMTLVGNWAYGGGGMLNFASTASLVNVTFAANSARKMGGGILTIKDNSSFVRVIFSANSSNTGGGMHNYTNNPSLVDVTFVANQATHLGGGMSNESSSPSLTNVTFIANQAGEWGGGMVNNITSNPYLVNVTFAANWAATGDGIFNVNISSPIVYNSILWGNQADTDPQIHNHQSDDATTLSFSDVQGGCPAGSTCEHLIDADPLFVRPPSPGPDGVWLTVDDDSGDLRLQDSSPAIDAGLNALLPTDVLDLDGDGNTNELLPLDLAGLQRRLGSAVELGAYEKIYGLYLPLVSQ